MSSAKPKKKESDRKDEFETSIFGRLIDEQKGKIAEEEFSNDVTVLFCGMKRSGKTSLIDRFINPAKDEKDVPKSTVALDYKFARYASETSTSKVLAHIYDLGGDENNENLVAIPVSATTVGNLVLAITVDLSEPFGVITSLEKCLARLREDVSNALDALSKQSPAGAARAQAVRKARADVYADHPDLSIVRPMAVSVVIFGTKFDTFSSDTDPQKKKSLCSALRFFAHVNGASLVFTSLKDKAPMNAMRGILRQLLFGVAAKGGATEQLDPSKPIYISAGKDNLASINTGASGTAQSWRELIISQFPDPQPALKGGKKATEGDQVVEDLAKHPESAVDGMVEQRTEELVQYRRQVERNQRLASEGVALTA